MSLIPNGFSKNAAGGAGFYDYPIDGSLRFNDNDSAYLSRPFGTPTNQNKWTLSLWVKRGNLGTAQTIIGQTYVSTSECFLRFTTGDKLEFQQYSSGGSTIVNNLLTTQVFRDPSAWYHIVVIFDSAGSGDDRQQIWVNGQRITSFSPATYSSNNSVWNQARAHHFGQRLASQYLDSYLTEINFIDGQALDPTNFGEEVSGVWKPIEYTGSYGTNGFYLPLTTDANDASGNSNNWTENNLASTDYVLDSPTNNFATLNPLATNGVTQTYSEGNLKVATASGNGNVWASMQLPSSGKWYWEVDYVAESGTASALIGIADYSPTAAGEVVSDSWLYFYDGRLFHNGSGTSVGAGYSIGDIVSVAVDVDADTVKFYVNNSLHHTETSAGVAEMFPSIADGRSSAGCTVTANFGQDSSFAGNKTAQGNTDDNGYGDFYYAPPTGYLALCTANLTVPDAMNPALDNSPQDYFNTVFYTGNRQTRTIDTGLAPDLTWIKTSNVAETHALTDRVRGASLWLTSNGTNTEYDYTAYDSGVNSFTSNGFTLGDDASQIFNETGRTYVAWNWKANGSGTSITTGSIDGTNPTIASTVSANTDAGFSIVSYAGTNTVSSTISHGLNSAPELAIVKVRNSGSPDWCVWGKDFTRLALNLANSDLGSYGATFSDTVVTTPNLANATWCASGYNYIMYCFHSVEGFSKIASYKGNSSTDGTFVYTGFRPAFLMVKRAVSTSTGSWAIVDSKRAEYNPETDALLANLNYAESPGYLNIDLLSNGFKLRDSGGTTNNSSSTYIYMAFAENPFKYANAR